MSSSLLFTQQPLDQRTYLLKTWCIPPRLQEAAMLKEMWHCSAEFGMGLFTIMNFRGSYTLEACGPQWISTKRQKSGMTLPLVRKAESFPTLSYKLKTHSFKKYLKSPSLNETYSLSISSTSAYSNLLLTLKKKSLPSTCIFKNVFFSSNVGDLGTEAYSTTAFTLSGSG